MTIEGDRQRLLARYPMALVIQTFVEGEAESQEIICPEPGTVIDGKRFLDVPTITPERMHHHIYDITKRMHYLKEKVWVQKRGRTVTLYRYDPKGAKR